MAITRTAIVDDDGSRTTGTVIGNAWKQELYNQIDAASAIQTVLAARTDTGAVNNWAPALAGNTYIPWNGAADVTFSGLAGGVAGQIVIVENITAAKVAYFPHASGLSSAANQFTNTATSGATPIAPGGKLAYMHNGTNWRLIFHYQGAWITPTFAAGDYTSPTGTWVVGSGDVIDCRFRLDGRTLSFRVWVVTTDVTGTPAHLDRVLPGGFTAAGNDGVTTCQMGDATGTVGYGVCATTTIQFFTTIGGGGWTAGAGRSINMSLKEIEVG